MTKLEVSVIIPTHRRRDYLFYELDHIFKQKDVRFEVIVVNDIEELDSTDDIISRYPDIIYIKDSKIIGPSNKHKAGYKIAKGKFLYMPDDDDYLTDEFFFRKAVDKMIYDQRLAFVSGQCQISYEYDDVSKNCLKQHQTKVRGRLSGSDYLQEFQHEMDKPLSTVSTIFRKQAFDETNAIEMVEMSDSSMYMQALLWGDAFIMNDSVAVYRIKGGSLTSTLNFEFMMSVLRQKYLLYKKSIGYVKNPRMFWYWQFILSYTFFPAKTNSIKWKLLFWGFRHSGLSLNLWRYLFRESINIILLK